MADNQEYKVDPNHRRTFGFSQLQHNNKVCNNSKTEASSTHCLPCNEDSNPLIFALLALPKSSA